jgi:DHA2 family multidrug resistance protein-like MFS transporter
MPRRLWATLVLLAGLAMATLDMTMANVALPAISSDLSITPRVAVWLVIAYTVTVLVGSLPFSALAERVGFRVVFTLGTAVFVASALVCAFASSFPVLLPARVAQGLGSAMLMSLFGGLLRNIFPLSKLGLGVSLTSLTVGVMAVLGPALGAVIIEVASWRWIFGLYVPIGFCIFLGVRILPEPPRVPRQFDWWSCALSMVAFGCFVVGLELMVSNGLQSLVLLALSAVAATLLWRRSRTQEAPLVPLDLLRVPPIAFAVGASLASFTAQMGAFVALPFYLIHQGGFEYGKVGVLLGSWSVGVAIMAPVSGWLSGRYKVSVLCMIGASLMAAGLLWTLLTPLPVAYTWLLAPLFMGGVGFGFFQSPNNRAMLAGAPRRRSGAAGGLQASTRVLGQSLGAALVAMAFHVSDQYGATLALVVAIVCALIAVAINVVRHLNPAPDLNF